MELGFESCLSDPCLFRRGPGEKTLIILCYVDDNLVIGKQHEIDRLLEEFKKSDFKHTLEEDLNATFRWIPMQ